ncbi:MAG TPA: hypothetical protein VK111_06500 [Virgibacillus sp.]|nr:hypothetical protein [Virgibacillus sp.]
MMMTAEETIEQLRPKIKKSLYDTHVQERDDLEQELKLKITECIHNDVFDEAPGFWEFARTFN